MPPNEVSGRLQLAAEAGWPFLMSPSAQRKWLGPEGSIPPTVDGTVVIPWAAGVWRTGIVDSVGENEVVVSLQPPYTWQAQHGKTTRVTITIGSDPKDGAALVTIAEDGYDGLAGTSDSEAARAEAHRFWSNTLEALQSLAAGARQRSDQVRQAVLVIHGIGEQTPGETVRSLVQAAAEDEERESVRSKPDRISKTFELRRWSLPGNKIRPSTDFFEVYWADKVRDTTISQVWAWIRRLMLRRPSTIPSSLKPVWWTVWIAALLTGFVVVSFLPTVDVEANARWLSFAGATVLAVVSGFMINSLGDAARYLWPHPANVAVRDRIRSSGVDLLDALHGSGRYHRLIVVGHSLGSVIAHDIVSEYWISTHQRHKDPVTVHNTQAAALADLVASKSPRPGDDDKGSQWSVWCEMRANTQPWLITDLITAGSPLTHAPLLLAASKEELNGMFDRKELAACPPRPGDDIWYDGKYIDQLGNKRSFRYLRHNAPFAVTRWTNLYFPVRFGFFGDLVGGPLAGVFGSWVEDRPVAWNAGPWRGRTLLAHTAYWRIPKTSRPGDRAHLDVFRAALDLGRREDLEELAKLMPREAWV
jgi:hypothetical protein